MFKKIIFNEHKRQYLIQKCNKLKGKNIKISLKNTIYLIKLYNQSNNRYNFLNEKQVYIPTPLSRLFSCFDILAFIMIIYLILIVETLFVKTNKNKLLY